MGPDVLAIGQNHVFDDVSKPMMLQDYRAEPFIVIEDDVWIGARAILLPGIRIGRGAIIGAGAVITKDVESFAIVAGNPARLIRYRQEKSKDEQ
jgi:maltose O-acetyltransferase